MKHIQGIQMIGTQRSGSNLLRVMLDMSKHITAPHPPHILQRFVPLLEKYGSLFEPSHFKKLVADVCELVNCNPVPWEEIIIEPGHILGKCQIPSLFEIFRVIYEEAALQCHTTLWLCKSMKNMYYFDELERLGLRPYYIYIYRDGRDVALSFKKAIVGEKHIYPIALNWENDQKQALWVKKHCPSDRFFMVSYERLITNPVPVLKELCTFLHIPYTESMLEFYASDEAQNTADGGRMWQNVSRPIMTGNIGKFKAELSLEEIRIFESVAGDVLETLGYKCEMPYDSRLVFTPDQIADFNAENKRLKAQFRQQVPAADLEKRALQRALLEKIRHY